MNNKKILISLALLLVVITGCGIQSNNSLIENQSGQQTDNSVKQDMADTETGSTSIDIRTSSLAVYENKDLGYKFEYPSDYKIINTTAEGVKAGIRFYNAKIENTPFQTDIEFNDQNFMLLLSEWNKGDVVVFDFSKEQIKKASDLKNNTFFASGTIEMINDQEFFKLSGSERAYYIVQNPNNFKFLVFGIFFPKQYGKDLNDAKIKNLDSMLNTLSFE